MKVNMNFTFKARRTIKQKPFKWLMGQHDFRLHYDLAPNGFCRKASDNKFYTDRFMKACYRVGGDDLADSVKSLQLADI
jgi:hypothetical protein